MANALSYQLIHIHACHEKQINKKRKTKNKNCRAFFSRNVQGVNYGLCKLGRAVQQANPAALKTRAH